MASSRPTSGRVRRALSAGASALLIGTVGLASGGSSTPYLKGTYEKGALSIPLYRGAAVPLELTVMKTPDVDAHVDLSIKWDEKDNWVKVKLKGKGVFEPYPTVTRTEGVDWLPNPFFPEPKDVHNGRYQLWIVTNGRPLTFWFDGTTLDLLGSELDFETPPAGAIPVPFPTLRLFPSDFFQPKPNGDLSFEWTFDYDKVVRGDRPDLTEMYLTFPPPNLCEVNPFRIDLSHLRPYGSKPAPASEAPSFGEYIRGGFIFDITVEPPTPFTDPPIHTNIGSYSQSTMQGGAMPRGWTLDIDAAFGNVAPPIRPWPGQGTGQQWTPPFHTKDINFCQ